MTRRDVPPTSPARHRRTAAAFILTLLLATPGLAQPAEESHMNGMDHGPFVSATLTRDPSTPRGIIAHKAIVVRVAPDAAMAFDTDLLRVVGGWTGGFLNWYPARDSLQEWPTPDGFMHFTTNQRPGWGVAPSGIGRGGGRGRGRGAGPAGLNDPRRVRYGPLPEGRRYTGLYQHGEDIVFAYRVGTSDILESFGFARSEAQPLFLRAIQLNPSGQALMLHVAQAGEGQATTVTPTTVTETSGYVEVRSGSEARLIGFQGLPAGSEWRLQDGHLVLGLPAGQETLTFRLAIGPVRSGDDTAYMTAYLQQAPPVTDLSTLTEPGEPLWEPLETTAVMGQEDGAFAVDTLTLPAENPWNSHIRLSAFDFLSDGRAVVVSLSGDVWLADGLSGELGTLRWQRFATGLNEPLGLRVVNDRIYVTGRDQITILHDRNNDGQADFYENFTNHVMAATNFHAFTLNLETDSRGNFYFAKATPWPPVSGGVPAEITPHHGVLFRVSPDGGMVEIIATGLRNPNGLSIGPNDEIYYADNEGNWVPTSKVHRIREGGFHGFVPSAHMDHTPTDDDFVKPMVWLPYFVDNSPSQPRVIANPGWPEDLQGNLLLTSYGRGTLSLLLPEEVDGQLQAAHVTLPLSFRSGLQHMRFHTDGHLYIVGMTNWQSTGHGQEWGSFHRVRYTGQPLNLPVELHTRAGGLEIRFSDPLDPAVATDASNYDLTEWTYAWNSSYGSQQGLFSARNPGEMGPDPVEVRAVRLSDDRRSVFLEIPSLTPGPAAPPVPMLDSLPDQIEASLGLVMAINYRLRTADGAELNQVIHKTIHRVPAAGSSVPAAASTPSTAPPAASTAPVTPAAPTTAAAPPPPRAPATGAPEGPSGGRVVELRATGINLAYDVQEIVAKAGETLTIRFVNASDMAHNVVVVKGEDDVAPVGNAAILAYATDWVPAGEAERIISATTLAKPGEEVSTTFVVPPPGTYPYICTYSGHWTLMRGILRSTE